MKIADTKEKESSTSVTVRIAVLRSNTAFLWRLTMKILKAILIILAILDVLVCYASCKVASDADDWAENEWRKMNEDD